MDSQNESASTVEAVETSLAIVGAIHDLDEPGITEVATHLDLPKSTVFNHVKTLQRNEYLVPNDPGSYRLGLQFLDHGIRARDHLQVFDASTPAMEQLADETQLAIWLAVEEFGEVVCIRKELGDRAVPTRGEIGRRLHMHSSSLGKAILAHLPEDRVTEVIEKFGLSARTENTVTDPSALHEELAKIADQGHALNDGESMEGLRAVASPIFVDGDVCGSICAAGTRSHVDGEYYESDLPTRVKDAANEIELNLKYES
jgi:DNA-binding IclR family transcriptional regulator